MMRSLLSTFIFLWSISTVFAQVLWEGKQQDPDSLVHKGFDYLRRDSLQQSVDLARTVLARYPDYTDFRYMLGLSYMKMGKPIWAEAYYKDVVNEAPAYYDAYYGLALARWTQGKHEEADYIWISLPEAVAKTDYVKQLHVEFLKATQHERNEINTQRVIKEIIACPSSNGITRLDSLLEHRADRLDLLQLKGNLLLLSGHDAEAMGTLDELIAADYNADRNRMTLAGIRATQKEFGKALQLMDTLVYRNPGQLEYQRLRSVYRDQRVYKNHILLEQGFVSYDRPVGTFFMSGLTYGTRVLPAVSISAQLNKAKLRNGEGFQYVMESWMNYSKSLYAYNSIGFSDSYVFPRWRMAYSLYKEYQSWQYDVGLRYMYPQMGLDNLTGVLSVGKYLGADFFYVRSFLTYNQERTETAFSASWRHYYNENKPETFFTLIGNIGTSPDDAERYLFYNNPSVFKSYGVTMGIQHRVGKYVIGSNGVWSSFKINDLDYLNQYNLNFSVKRYF